MPRQEEAFRLARWYGGMSDRMYQPNRLSGTDAIDAERYRIAAKCFRVIGQGLATETAILAMRVEWLDFCDEMAAKVNAAPKIRTGPRSGQSSIAHKHAGQGEIDANEVFIRNAMKPYEVAAVAA